MHLVINHAWPTNGNGKLNKTSSHIALVTGVLASEVLPGIFTCLGSMISNGKGENGAQENMSVHPDIEEVVKLFL